MSNIYILEPPTCGKVLLTTTVGDIEIELWAKETPRACRNFIQLCLEGYYDNTVFHRVVKEFIVQGGDPNGDGTGGESIYGEPFKDEFHQRLRYTRRGLLGMANSDKDDNGSQFFFTLGPTPELQNKNTLFGKVVGETLFNMLKLEEGLIEDEKPVYPHKILKTEVLNNPFSDIEPRTKHQEVKEKKKKEKKAGVKNFKLLSFGEEAEEDEEQSLKENEKFVGKGKSSHDISGDASLSSKTETQVTTEDETNEDIVDTEEQLNTIRKKLKGKQKKPVSLPPVKGDDDDEDFEFEDDRHVEKKRKLEQIKKDIQEVKKDYHKNKLRKDEAVKEEKKEEESRSATFEAYKEEYDEYKNKTKKLPKKGAGREKFTLDLLEKFKQKLHSAKEKEDEEEEKTEEKEDIDDEQSWLSHKLKFEDENPVLAKDANQKDDDWFEIYDPRNPLNKRRRGEKSAKKT